MKISHDGRTVNEEPKMTGAQSFRYHNWDDTIFEKKSREQVSYSRSRQRKGFIFAIVLSIRYLLASLVFFQFLHDEHHIHHDHFHLIFQIVKPLVVIGFVTCEANALAPALETTYHA